MFPKLCLRRKSKSKRVSIHGGGMSAKTLLQCTCPDVVNSHVMLLELFSEHGCYVSRLRYSISYSDRKADEVGLIRNVV